MGGLRSNWARKLVPDWVSLHHHTGADSRHRHQDRLGLAARTTAPTRGALDASTCVSWGHKTRHRLRTNTNSYIYRHRRSRYRLRHQQWHRLPFTIRLVATAWPAKVVLLLTPRFPCLVPGSLVLGFGKPARPPPPTYPPNRHAHHARSARPSLVSLLIGRAAVCVARWGVC